MPYWLILVFIIISGCSFSSDYTPWVEDEFFFYKLNETREYTFKPSNLSRPEVVIYDSSCNLPTGLFSIKPDGSKVAKFNWNVTAKVIRKNKIIESITLKPITGWLSDNSLDCYKSISLGIFDSISGELFPKEVKVIISVNKVDSRYSIPNDELSLGIRNSPIL